MNLEFFFFYFSVKMGRSGDGKRNILLGWPYSQILISSDNLRSQSLLCELQIILDVLSPVELQNLFFGFVAECKTAVSSH